MSAEFICGSLGRLGVKSCFMKVADISFRVYMVLPSEFLIVCVIFFLLPPELICQIFP